MNNKYVKYTWRTRFFISKAYFRLWLAKTFLYRQNSDKHEFSRLLSPTLKELEYLNGSGELKRFQFALIDARNKVGHHGKYEKVCEKCKYPKPCRCLQVKMGIV